jgi:hypothetical protein
MKFTGKQRNGSIFIVKLSSSSPHPHASISHLSQFAFEKEVLFLPFFPLRELRRWDEGKITYIEVEQNPNDSSFTLDVIKSKHYWEK